MGYGVERWCPLYCSMTVAFVIVKTVVQNKLTFYVELFPIRSQPTVGAFAPSLPIEISQATMDCPIAPSKVVHLRPQSSSVIQVVQRTGVLLLPHDHNIRNMR